MECGLGVGGGGGAAMGPGAMGPPSGSGNATGTSAISAAASGSAAPQRPMPAKLPPGQMAMMRLQQILTGPSSSSDDSCTPSEVEEGRREAQRPIGEENKQLEWMLEQQQYWLGQPEQMLPVLWQEQGEAPDRPARAPRARGLTNEERIARRKKSLSESNKRYQAKRRGEVRFG
jgi:hypothetical protein